MKQLSTKNQGNPERAQLQMNAVVSEDFVPALIGSTRTDTIDPRLPTTPPKAAPGNDPPRSKDRV